MYKYCHADIIMVSSKVKHMMQNSVSFPTRGLTSGNSQEEEDYHQGSDQHNVHTVMHVTFRSVIVQTREGTVQYENMEMTLVFFVRRFNGAMNGQGSWPLVL